MKDEPLELMLTFWATTAIAAGIVAALVYATFS